MQNSLDKERRIADIVGNIHGLLARTKAPKVIRLHFVREEVLAG